MEKWNNVYDITNYYYFYEIKQNVMPKYSTQGSILKADNTFVHTVTLNPQIACVYYKCIR